MIPRHPLTSRHIDIWLVFYQTIAGPELQAALLALLNDTERQQQIRFYRPDDRLRYLATRALVRTTLSRYAPVAPADWTFIPNDYRRPAISNAHAEARSLNFNVSHTRGLIALCAERLDGTVPLVTVRSVMPTVSDAPFAWTLLKRSP
ncbi:4'-phosphopantetheinyl transferase family protein [Massilia scottii]|uniref:4'-phosphopantetheinyl transferase family protein n=1 Tax=Massilia scottii TaxID=3057166 RepID=UPI0027969F49|nr:hypothetical protein [Massilia sp. CCM 9029]MDQ1833764.1 hypothetical protein [Massilia sp. CCM 9029]